MLRSRIRSCFVAGCALSVALHGVTNRAAAQEATPRPPALRTPQTSDAKSDDVRSIDGIMAAIYDVITGPAGQERNWDRMRSLFHPGARMIPSGLVPDGSRAVAVVQSLEDYIRINGPFFMQRGFFEEELHREVHHFGHIAQVFSSYSAKNTLDGPVFSRGMNSIQLLNDGTRWWVMGIFWNPESPREPLQPPWDGSAVRPNTMTTDTTVIYLVRHAETTPDGTPDPSLSAIGESRAKVLASRLKDARLTGIFSTNLKRTLSTAAPVAAATGITPHVYAPPGMKPLADSLTQVGGRFLIVGHSNTTPAMASLFGVDPGRPIAEAEFDRLYMIVIPPGRPSAVTVSRYGGEGAAF